MFTVKVVTQGRPQSQPIASGQAVPGNQQLEPFTTEEVVFEATQVRMARDGRLVSCDFDGGDGVQEVRAHAAGDPDPVGHVYCDTETGQIVYDVSAVAQVGVDVVMYVMNRFGATVAKYYL